MSDDAPFGDPATPDDAPDPPPPANPSFPGLGLLAGFDPVDGSYNRPVVATRRGLELAVVRGLPGLDPGRWACFWRDPHSGEHGFEPDPIAAEYKVVKGATAGLIVEADSGLLIGQEATMEELFPPRIGPISPA